MVRFGLFGTGYWAAEVHAAALTAAAPQAELVGVWGRNPAKAATLAERYGCGAYEDVDALIQDVDAIDVALPPDVQAPIASRAAAAGRHLLLDKPLAMTPAAADEVVAAARATDVASVVFFTNRFHQPTAQWLQEATAQRWHGAEATWVDCLHKPGSPFTDSPWRDEKGGLWDIGPHTLSMTIPLLGAVEQVHSAVRDAHGTVHFVAEHASGTISTHTLGLDVPPAAAVNRISLYGETGWSTMPSIPNGSGFVDALGEALRQLLANIAAGTGAHSCDVGFAAEVVTVLAQAEALIVR